MAVYEYKIVAGWNNTTANVEGLSVAGATSLEGLIPILDAGTHIVVAALGQWNVNYQFTAGGVAQNGYEVITWTFPLISTIALKHMIDTYAQGSSESGKVTVNTRALTETYTEYNAFMFIQPPNRQPKCVRDGLYVYDAGEVTARLAITGETA